MTTCLLDPSVALAEAESISKEAQRASDLKLENVRQRETIEELRGQLHVAKSRGACAAVSYCPPFILRLDY